MSIRVMSNVWEHSEQRGAPLLVLLALADWANDRGECDPSYAQLAKKARVDRRRAVRIVQGLESSGDLEREIGAGFTYAKGATSNRLVLRRYVDPSGARATTPGGTGTTTLVAPVPLPPVVYVPPTTVNSNGQQQQDTPVGGGANDAPRRDVHATGDDVLRDADVEQRELDRAARHSLGLTIAAEVGVNPEDAVYRKGKQAGRLNADFGEMVGQVRKVAGSYPAAFLVWGAFRDSVPDAEWERFGAIGAVKTRFNRWAANGGAPKIEQARAMFGGGS